MLKKISMLFAVGLLVASMALSAIAADVLNGKVTKVESDKVTVSIEGALPAWLKTGATLAVKGAAPKVIAIAGNEVTLRFSRSKAAKIKVDSILPLSEAGDSELQGC